MSEVLYIDIQGKCELKSDPQAAVGKQGIILASLDLVGIDLDRPFDSVRVLISVIQLVGKNSSVGSTMSSIGRRVDISRTSEKEMDGACHYSISSFIILKVQYCIKRIKTLQQHIRSTVQVSKFYYSRHINWEPLRGLHFLGMGERLIVIRLNAISPLKATAVVLI